MQVAIIATILFGLYCLTGMAFIALNATAIARSHKTFLSRWRYAIYCAFAWPWVKVNK
jgi:hypothetical protein